MKASILLVESDVLAAWEKQSHLTNEGLAVFHARSLTRAIELFLARPERFDLILADPRIIGRCPTVGRLAGVGMRLSSAMRKALDAEAALISIRDAAGGLVYSNARYDSLRQASPCGSGSADCPDYSVRRGISSRERLHDLGSLGIGMTIEPEEFFDEGEGRWRGFLTTRVPLCGMDRKPFGVVAISVDLADGEAVARLSREAAFSPIALFDEGWDEPVLAGDLGWPTLEFAAG